MLNKASAASELNLPLNIRKRFSNGNKICASEQLQYIYIYKFIYIYIGIIQLLWYHSSMNIRCCICDAEQDTGSERTKPPLEHKESERAALTERCARESENASEHERMNRARGLR